MKEYMAYQCEHCKKIFREKEKCADHELECSYNPSTKKCDTCSNLGYEYGNDFCKIWSEKPTYDFYDERKTCPFYEGAKL
jgi:hypothetical protein